MMRASNETGVLKLTIGLVLCGLVLFGASITHPFHFDDALIVSDTNVTTPGQWRHFLSPFYLRQLTFFTFYLNHLVANNNPAGFHLVNVALHIANAALLLFLLIPLIGRQMAWIAAAIFLVHPIQTEPVLYVYQRSILLGCFFSLLALLAYREKKPWVALLLFACAFEGKESSLAIPLLLALALSVNRIRRKTAVCFGALAVAFGIGAMAILSHQGETTVGFGLIPQVTPISYLLTQSRVVYTYFRLLFFPYSQSVEYDFPWISGLNAGVVLQISGVLLVVSLGLILARSEGWRTTGNAILAFFVLLAPTSSVVPSADAAFEHRLYLPMLAFSVFAASLICRIRRPGRLAIPLVILLSVLTLHRSTVWASDLALWENAVQHVPNKARAWFNLGGASLQVDPDRARAAYERAVELRPDYAEAYYDLGVLDQSKGKYSQAVQEYVRATQLKSDYWPAWNNLGNALVALGDPERALGAFEMTLRLNPDHWPSQYNIAVVHFNSGRFQEAIPRLRTVLDWRPDFRDARYLLAVSLSRTGQQAEAEREWKKIGQPGQPPMPTTIPDTAR
jgi:tetratricopeptide (TPR) repeat protein